MTLREIPVERPADLNLDAIRACAAGASVRLSAGLLEQVAARRGDALELLADGPDVYGVTTGMGALSGTRLSEQAQAEHSTRLMLGRAVGGPPWLERREVRAMIAVRLRTFLELDAAVSARLCGWLATLLERDIVPAVPRTGSGAAGEIIPLAHAWGHLAGVGRMLGPGQTTMPAAEALAGLSLPELGPKEGLALLAGVPTTTALAVLRAVDIERLVLQWTAVAAGEVALMGANRDPYRPEAARGDAQLVDIARSIMDLAGADHAPRHLQAPVSFRVMGAVLAHLRRSAESLVEVAERALGTVTDSPAYLVTSDGPAFIGTAGFHGLDHAAAFDAARAALVHVAAVGAARIHRMLDPRFTGLSAQLSVDPGPHAGLTAVHKRAVAVVHEVAGWPASNVGPAETSGGQEDVQTFAMESGERLRLGLDAAEQVLACELLTVHQAGQLDPTRRQRLPPSLSTLLDQVAHVLPGGVADRPWGDDVERLRGLLRDGWALPSSRG